MKLYYFETPNPRKPCAVARYLDAPVEFVRVDLTKGEHKTSEFLALNPNGKVPVLSDGDVTIWESHAIMAYLAAKAGSDLWPSDTARQIEIMRWLLWDTAHFSRHAGTLYFENFFRPTADMGDPKRDAIDEATGFFKRFAGVLNAHLSGRRYLVHDTLSIADFGAASVLPTAREAQLPLDEFPEITRWHDQLMALPAWKAPFPASGAESA